MTLSIVTRIGDQGTTGLHGVTCVSKDDARIEAIGTVDELNALLGVLVVMPDIPQIIAAGLQRIQHQLFLVGADLATPMESAAANAKRVTERHVTDLETWIMSLEATLPAVQWFILPGGSPCGAALHHARTVCRRAERRIVTLAKAADINPQLVIYLNRLSDLLFLLARTANREANKEEVRVMYA
jgi:cob(I)alamin adenosyltransferase